MSRTILLLFSLLFLVFGEVVYFPDRSPKLYYQPAEISGDLSVFFVGKTVQTDSISELYFADLVSSYIGGPVFHTTINQGQSIFSKDRANLMFVVNGVSEDIAGELNLKVLKQDGSNVKIDSQYYPQDTIAQFTTLVTGYGPVAHGIVNATWVSSSGPASAYTTVATVPQVTTLSDGVTQSFDGRSLIITVSSDCQVASVFGPNRYVNRNLFKSIYTYCYNTKSDQFENLITNSVNFTRTKMTQAIRSTQYTLRSHQDQIQFSTDTNQVFVDFTKDNVHAVFDLNNFNDFLFFAEIQMTYQMLASVKDSTESMRNMVTDEIPDLFTFAYASIQHLSGDKQKAAILLLDGVISKVTAEMNDIYGRVSTQIVLKGETAYERVHRQLANSEFAGVLYDKLASWIGDKTRFRTGFPSLYLENLTLKRSREACKYLKKKSLDEYADLTAVCVNPSQHSFLTKVYSAVTGVNSVSDDDVAIFQVLIWFNILLVVVVIASVLSIFYMDMGSTDTILYRGPVAGAAKALVNKN